MLEFIFQSRETALANNFHRLISVAVAPWALVATLAWNREKLHVILPLVWDASLLFSHCSFFYQKGEGGEKSDHIPGCLVDLIRCWCTHVLLWCQIQATSKPSHPFSNFRVILVERKERVLRGDEGRRCRYYERHKTKSWGDWSLSHTGSGEGRVQGTGKLRGCRCCSPVRET